MKDESTCPIGFLQGHVFCCSRKRIKIKYIFISMPLENKNIDDQETHFSNVL